jgi:two-component system chemotaxis sensor kinase CheA
MSPTSQTFLEGMDEIAQEFLVETYENLDELDRALVALEQDPGSREQLASVFRTIHTIKGTSGFLAFNRLESVTHVGENVLSRLRDGHLALTPQITGRLLEMVDVVRVLLESIERNGVEDEIDTSAVEAALAACLVPPAEQAVEVGEDVTTEGAEVEPVPVEPVVEPIAVEPVEVATVEHVEVAVAVVDPVEDEATIVDPVADDQRINSARALPEPEPEPATALRAVAVSEPDDEEPTEGEGTRRSVAGSTIRVDVGLLDQLMRLVGELVLTRNQVVQYVGDLEHAELLRASQRLNLIASELQEGVMKTRMQPIEQVWAKLPRMVRDLGAQCGKQVRLVMEGRETELDRTLLEAVKDPLTHLVRNAIDHGLESPAARAFVGKPAEGTLALRAYHEGGQVVVEVIDDGAGIDADKVRAKAIERGIITSDQAAQMAQREVLDLIFRPGFSTAAAVTNVSGRGVGMDVVRTNIEKIGGTVDLSSKEGSGTTVRVRIPLTLAIIPALVVGQNGAPYAIPQANLLELVRLEGGGPRVGIEHVAGAPVYRLRGTLLPLVFLAEQLKLPPTEGADALNIVVLAADNTHFGLVVEEISDTQEIVVRPLSRQIKHVDVFAGATITGDGKVALILDVAGIAQRATLPRGASDRFGAGADSERSGDSELAGGENLRLLVCQVSGGRRLALPMANISRLEEFSVGQVERAGDFDVVQYRGDLLRLVHVSAVLGDPPSDERPESYTVVVHRHGDETAVGLVVDRILDVVEEEFLCSEVGARVGLRGSAVLQSRVTDIVDVPALVAAAAGAGSRG